VVHDGRPQCPVEVFHESVSHVMVGCRPQEQNATPLSQRLEKLRFELTSLVCGDGMRATEGRYPADQ
jgi:hypothetical protein